MKTIFVAFAIEDQRQRDLLKGQSLAVKSPFEFIDMSVKEPYKEDWKGKVRTRIRRSHGVIALISASSRASSGQQWEIACARAEGKRVLPIWAYSDDRTHLSGLETKVWTWPVISNFIDSLLVRGRGRMRKALVVGIDYYSHLNSLNGCVNDAFGVKAVLERHADGSVNFDTKSLIGASSSDVVERSELKEAIRELFSDDADVCLLYFAGHGHIEDTGGYLCAGDCKIGDDGLALADVMALANRSSARNRIIILDSCHSGVVADNAALQGLSELREGTTILTASTASQYATEKDGSGVFTSLMIDALNGAAANLVGDVTPGSVYAHVDQSLGAWAQRPVFKTNVKRFVSLRRVHPPISLDDLHQITELFPHKGYEFPLDPSFEPTSEHQVPENTRIFAILQRYNRVNLAVPVGATHPYFSAMERKTMKLTVLGEHYRKLVEDDLL